MTFVTTSLAIAGVAAASIPILIHLLLRRRRRPMAWAAMTLLMEAARRHRRRSRLEQILLLTVRAILVAVLGVALAQPLLGERSTILGTRTAHLVIDDGLASGLVESDGRTTLERQSAEAIAVIESLGGNDRVAVTLAGSPVRHLVFGPSTDHRSTIRAIEGLTSREGATDLSGALDLVNGGIDETGKQEVRIFSDFRRGSLDDRRRPSPIRDPSDTPIELIASPPTETTDSNTQIVSIETARTPLSTAGAGDLLLVEVGLRRTGVLDAAVTNVRLGGDAISSVENRRVEWSVGRADARVDFQIRVDEDGGVLEATIDPDALPLDDRRVTIVPGREPTRVLLVDREDLVGATRLDRLRGTDWFERALLPSPDTAIVEAIDVDRVDPATIGERDLDGVTLLVVGRPDLLQNDFNETLANWVRRGGVLVVVPPGETTIRAWASPMLERLDLPWSVALESAVVDPPRRLPSEQPDSPITGLIGSEMIELAPSVRIDRRLPVDGVPDGDLVLVDEAGDPVLLDAPVGAGRVVFFAVTPELAWTDLPVRPLMVPLVQEIARQGTALSRRGGDGVVGARSPTFRSLGITRITMPGMSDRDVDDDGAGVPERSGVAIGVDLAGRTVEQVVINPDVMGGMVEPVGRDAVAAWLEPAGSWRFTGSEVDALEVIEDRGSLAVILVAVVLGLAIIELLLARWFARGGLRNRQSRGLTGANADAEIDRSRPGGAAA
ncbi:MAG: hypothetical protein CMJ27_10035 [Phycisphaerae bacterium]|nr:hypothetical protein [Phycisphaerae bacterium]OUX92906.1 MAG: hypothetical protein CBB77_10950 [Hyphomonas sp. TMED17]